MMEVLQPSWRGNGLQTRKDSSGKYMSLVGSKALLYIPVDVLPDSVYKITLELKTNGGNGIAHCNIFGNKKYDFPHRKIECKNNGWSTYDVEVSTKSFPKTLPLVFRIWRSPNGSGELCIRRIVVTLLEGEKEALEEPQLISTDNVGSINVKKEVPHKKPDPPNKVEDRRVARKKEREEARRRAGDRKRERRKRAKGDPTKGNPKIPMPTQPKVLPIVEDGIKVSVVISSFNRYDFFDRTLRTYAKQTMPKEDFELIVVDDGSSDDIFGLCKQYHKNYGLQFQLISFDKTKGAVEAKTFTPALSNNIGFKNARGSVIVITGPETLQKETNLENSWNYANEGYCIYGNIYRSNISFVDSLRKDNKLIESSFDNILSAKGAKADASVFNGWWWYYVAVRREHIMSIGGVDERFMLGITGEDDNFANRMMASGVPLARKTDVVGIHQDHSKEDKKEPTHGWRYEKKRWKELRRHNERLLHEWDRNKNPVANGNINWGTEDAIITLEIL